MYEHSFDSSINQRIKQLGQPESGLQLTSGQLFQSVATYFSLTLVLSGLHTFSPF